MTLEAHYPLTEDTGNVALDYSGNGNDGSITGAGPAGTGTVAGPFGNSAYDFDATGDTIDIGDPTELQGPNIGNSITLSGWIKPDVVSDGHYIIAKASNSSSDVYRLQATSSGVFAVIDSTSTSGGSLSDNTWAFCAMTYDSSNIRVYLDGVEVGSISANEGTIDSTASPVAIGSRGGDSSFSNKSLADIRIYSRALSPQEIQALYQAGERSEAVFGVTDSTATARSVSGGGAGGGFYGGGGGGGGSSGGGGGGTNY